MSALGSGRDWSILFYYEIDQPIGVHDTSMIDLIDLSLDTLDMVS